MSTGPPPPLRLGIIGLGRAFTLMLPTLVRHPLVHVVAACDSRPEARAAFELDFQGAAYAEAEALCADTTVQAVYVASPHQLHRAHVTLAAAHGKHVLVEKPMALTLDDAQAMIAATAAAGVQMLVGHSHSFDVPYLRARELIASGEFGRVRMITAYNATDFLYRPRRPEELQTSQGGGVVFSQAAHQVDIVRLLAASKAVSVRALTGAWDAVRPTEGAYSALITFADGAFASLTYSGYGRFDTDEFQGWTGELGQRRDPAAYGAARKALAHAHTVKQEIALKNTRAYGPARSSTFMGADGLAHNHFGLVVVACERADLRPMPDGVMIYGDDIRRLDPLPPPAIPRRAVIDEFHAAVVDGVPPLHSGAWGLATLEICIALLQSARDGREIELRQQV